MRKIVGIDPGLNKIGWGIVGQEGNRLIYITSGSFSSGKEGMAQKLLEIHEKITSIITQHEPQVAAIEETFVNTNPVSSLKLGHARGVLILSAAKMGLEVFEYTPNAIKKAVTGHGKAEKEQVMGMVKLLLPSASPGSFDESDALAIAICHASNFR